MIDHKTAVVFPGQGSQSVGMLADVGCQYPAILDTFREASDLLSYDLWALSQQGPAERLNQTEYTQPVLLTASYAIWRILQQMTQVHQVILAGHSLGEYTALVCAQALTFADALRLVAARGRLMQAAVPAGVGAMGAIVGLDDDVVASICEQARTSPAEVIAPANYNSLGQVVVAGHHEAVTRALALAKTAGAKLAMLIPVSVPSHCSLMMPAAAALTELLIKTPIATPQITVINNVAAQPYTDAASIREGLSQQLAQPVRWVGTIQAMMQAGVTQIIECGPGKVLSGLNKRIDKSLLCVTTTDSASITKLAGNEYDV